MGLTQHGRDGDDDLSILAGSRTTLEITLKLHDIFFAVNEFKAAMWMENALCHPNTTIVDLFHHPDRPHLF